MTKGTKTNGHAIKNMTVQKLPEYLSLRDCLMRQIKKIVTKIYRTRLN
jgi:hypothetical protein